MPTVFSHAAVPLALGLGLGREAVPPRLLAAGVLVSALPDLDVLTHAWGVSYAAPLGHRGFSHSLLFAVVVALVGAAAARALRAPPGRALAFLLVAGASHGALDSLTTGGLGVAFLWPWSDERFFAPRAVRVIAVSPLGLHFFSRRGLTVLASELVWIWPAALASSLILMLERRRRSRRRPGGRA
ncbi:MAG TPA: metal-dependent hydrolase [Methylomirabilota bacterium]|nr:metal-dependent hydrolase [Methylomirabilota bacterium]